MAAYKKQHYVPVAYLKNFRSNPSETNRKKQRIWRDDSHEVLEVKVEKQCCEDWAYRKPNERPEESEQGFKKFEDDWRECLVRARSGKPESALLTMQQLMFHFRNLSVKWELADMDAFDAIWNAVVAFAEKQVLELPEGTRFTDDPKHVSDFPWETRLIAFGAPVLVTSDNPSVVTALPQRGRAYGPLFLPVSPSELLVTVDPTRIRFNGNSPEDRDAQIANLYVAYQRIEFVFSSTQYQHRTHLWKAVSSQPNLLESARAHLDGLESRSRASLMLYDHDKLGFSFLELVGLAT
jgi:hypothetical protein